jgi:hypothetical protein
MTKQTGRRARRQVRIWSQSFLKPMNWFQTTDGARYGVHQTGAFVRLDKDNLSPKERKRVRREARLAAAASV